MNWLKALFSADNSVVDTKAVLSIWASFVAILVFLAYAVKGLICACEMPLGVRDISVGLLVTGMVGAGSTLFNQKFGTCPPPAPTVTTETTTTITPSPPNPGAVG